MQESKIILLNREHQHREEELATAEATLNTYLAEGWTLVNAFSPNDVTGAVYAVLIREKK